MQSILPVYAIYTTCICCLHIHIIYHELPVWYYITTTTYNISVSHFEYIANNSWH